MPHSEGMPKNNKSSSSSSQRATRLQGSSQASLEQLPGGQFLLDYKDILENALQAFPDHDPGIIREDKVLKIKDYLDKVEVEIKEVSYEATRRQFAIDEKVVSYYVGIASNELAAVISLIRLYSKDITSMEQKAACAREADKSLKNFKFSINEALTQFASIKTLKRKKQ